MCYGICIRHVFDTEGPPQDSVLHVSVLLLYHLHAILRNGNRIRLDCRRGRVRQRSPITYPADQTDLLDQILLLVGCAMLEELRRVLTERQDDYNADPDVRAVSARVFVCSDNSGGCLPDNNRDYDGSHWRLRAEVVQMGMVVSLCLILIAISPSTDCIAASTARLHVQASGYSSAQLATD
jgi:hypothetical protein